MGDEGLEVRETSPLLMGDSYEGAYGRTIILIAISADACGWLQGVFRELALGGLARTLTAQPELRFQGGETIETTRRPDGPRVTLRYSSDETTLVWSGTADGWLYLADLIQPLVDGKAGHQYLTDDKDDVALIELSYGEQDVLDAARSSLGGADGAAGESPVTSMPQHPFQASDLALLREAIEHHGPDLAPLLEKVGRSSLADHEREALRSVLDRELLSSGLDSNDEPTARGLRLEDLVDRLAGF